jgi:tRNA-dihydrouridine synthase B
VQVGPFHFDSQVLLAPMSGVTDRPFREICRELGAALAASEMIAAAEHLRRGALNLKRMDVRGERAPRVVQIAGADPRMMALAARLAVDAGAQIVDINMGCPAKKVCNAMAGSALLQDEALVQQILEAVVGAVMVPVTLKMRTGWRPERRNGVNVARLAEAIGVKAIAVHGRTRACGYGGAAEYETIQRIKRAVAVPVIANGDIRTPEQAQRVLECTGADAVMLGRAVVGNPWLIRDVDHFLRTGARPAAVGVHELRSTVVRHLDAVHAFHGPRLGARLARKHLKAYLGRCHGGMELWRQVAGMEDARLQRRTVDCFFDRRIGEAQAA